MRRKYPICPSRFSRPPQWTGHGAFPPQSACTWTRTSGTGTAWSATTCPLALHPSQRSCAALRRQDRKTTLVVAAGRGDGDRPQHYRCVNEKYFIYFIFVCVFFLNLYLTLGINKSLTIMYVLKNQNIMQLNTNKHWSI